MLPKSWGIALGVKEGRKWGIILQFAEKTNDRWFCPLRPRCKEGIRNQLPFTSLLTTLNSQSALHQVLTPAGWESVRDHSTRTVTLVGVSGIVQKHTVFVIPLHFHNSPMKHFPVWRWEEWSLKKLNNSPKIMQLVNAPLLLASVPCLAAAAARPCFPPDGNLTSNLNLCGPPFLFFFFRCKFRTGLHSCQGYFFQNSKYFQKEVHNKESYFPNKFYPIKIKGPVAFLFFPLFWYVCVIQVTEFRKGLKTRKNCHVVFWYMCKPNDSKEKGTFLRYYACPVDPDKFNCLILTSISMHRNFSFCCQKQMVNFICAGLYFKEDYVFMHIIIIYIPKVGHLDISALLLYLGKFLYQKFLCSSGIMPLSSQYLSVSLKFC